MPIEPLLLMPEEIDDEKFKDIYGREAERVG